MVLPPPSEHDWPSTCVGSALDGLNCAPPTRPRVAGKFLRCGARKFHVKGFSYGPFAPNSAGEPLPERDQVRRDFAHVRMLGANTVRLYFPPPVWLLDEALHHGLRVFIDIPWEKHRCFFEDWEAMERARDHVRQTARELGNHPAVLALSVVNELPVDVVRFQGRHRTERFIEELLTIAKNEAPECLVTFVNFPTTEFLEVQGADFTCFNVYVHDDEKFGEYLDRLQHIAGNKPLILGEYGIDSQRESEADQAALLATHLRRVFRHGLAGSVIFAYTDDWFTGGHQIKDWFFGVTRADRTAKPAAIAVKDVWAKLPDAVLSGAGTPQVSVVVCSYNGSRTLRKCLDSLVWLEYPHYEIILVDDGSTDGTAEIAAQFPQVVYYHQENQGLSVARNVGARMAQGEIVAYTDDDCVVDEHWLHYLVQAMQDQQVEGIGGPNLTPDFDGWVAKCVAASPGNPSHVMLDDRHAEHVPGCNMAFRRSTLLEIGGFDAQFRVAGDDVDICWRLLDAGLSIGYAPGAMVWHHRRATVKAYLKQQAGYGRSEALVRFKHPGRFTSLGCGRWNGVIYGDGAVGLPLMPDRIYHGQFGSGLFQTIYRHNHFGSWWIVMCLEWHLAALFFLLLSTLFWPLIFVSLVMWGLSTACAIRSAIKASLPRGAPGWCRPLVACLHLMQPAWRGCSRLVCYLRNRRFAQIAEVGHTAEVKRISASVRDLYWENDTGKGRYDLLPHLLQRARNSRWAGDFDNAWAAWDVKLTGDPWHDLFIRVATEELGWPRRFTRARCIAQATLFNVMITSGASVWCLLSLATQHLWGAAVGLATLLFLLIRVMNSRRSCLQAATRLVAAASIDGGFLQMPATHKSPEAPARKTEAGIRVPQRSQDRAGPQYREDTEAIPIHGLANPTRS